MTNPTNVEYKIEDNILKIEIDLTQKGVLSHSGKSILVASTHGSLKLDNGMELGLNVYKRIPKPKIDIKDIEHGLI